MPRYAAFLRAVNVGGRFVRMAEVTRSLTDAGFGGVSTYIQSGNVVLSSTARSAARVEALLEPVLAECCGFDVTCMVRSDTELDQLVEFGASLVDPFGGDGRHMVSFLKDAPEAGVAERVAEWPEPLVSLSLTGRQLHAFYGMRMLDSKLTPARMQRLVGTSTTTREWRVVEAVAALLRA